MLICPPMKISLRPSLGRTQRLRLAASFALGLLVTGWSAEPAAPRYGVGTKLETLQVGKVTYQQVQVRSINARTVMIAHGSGMASIRLSELSPELQQAFAYDPEAAAAADASLKQAHDASQQALVKAAAQKPIKTAVRAPSAFDGLLRDFGELLTMRPGVDLRPKFLALSLGVKDQGARPSCAVFAIVSALEFQNAQLKGATERFSEEYLIWATRKTLKRPVPLRSSVGPGETPSGDSENLDDFDEGFALSEVVTALRAYGIPLQSRLPYTFAKTAAAADPPGDVVDEAQNHRRVSIVALPGRDQPSQLANLIRALHAGFPVPVGIRWPPWRTVRNGFLHNQRPKEGAGHAVTIVGYENKTGKIEDTVFIFKNSWGTRWGAGGYGFVTYGYLMDHLLETALLEVDPAPAGGRR